MNLIHNDDVFSGWDQNCEPSVFDAMGAPLDRPEERLAEGLLKITSLMSPLPSSPEDRVIAESPPLPSWTATLIQQAKAPMMVLASIVGIVGLAALGTLVAGALSLLIYAGLGLLLLTLIACALRKENFVYQPLVWLLNQLLSLITKKDPAAPVILSPQQATMINQ